MNIKTYIEENLNEKEQIALGSLILNVPADNEHVRYVEVVNDFMLGFLSEYDMDLTPEAMAPVLQDLIEWASDKNIQPNIATFSESVEGLGRYGKLQRCAATGTVRFASIEQTANNRE